MSYEANSRDEAVFNSNNGKCFMCGKRLSFSNRTVGEYGAWEVGHKIPKSRGGSDNLRNLVPLCWNCNRGTGTLGVRYVMRRYMEPATLGDFVKEIFGFKGVRRQIKRDWEFV
jgi:5-methylcytosine-specific restriction endonuclease McrA